MTLARRKDLAMLALVALVVVVDQLTKAWVVSYFGSGRPPVQLLGPVLELDYVQNPGVAFSMFSGDAIKFVLIAVALGVICYLYWKTRDTATLLLKLSFGLILGGAIGNLVDRFSHAASQNYVVDFIHFQIPGIFDFAVFNVADSAITVGVVLLAFLLWRSNLLASGDAATSLPTASLFSGGAGLTARVTGKRAPAQNTPTQATARLGEAESENGGAQASATPPLAPGSVSGER